MMTNFRDQVANLIQHIEKNHATWMLAGYNHDEYVNKLISNAEFAAWHEQGKLQAFVAFYCNDPNHDTAFISMVAVATSRRRTKLGSALLGAALVSMRARSFRTCRLHVHPDNHAAISLYRTHGFHEIGVEGEKLTMEVAL